MFLAVAGVIAKVIGAFYKVPLVGVLGAEGIGIYQLVFPMYTTLLTLASGGIPQAVSRATARSLAEGRKGESVRLLGVATLSLTAIGLVGSALLALCGSAVARAQGNVMAWAAYVALAPSVLLVSVLAAFRGWWQGQNNMFPTAISQLVEQVVKLAAGLWLAAAFMPMGVEWGVAGAAAGITLSELLAVVVLGVGLLFRRLRRRKPATAAPRAETAEIAEMAEMPALPVGPALPADAAAVHTPKTKISVLLGDIYKSALPISFGSLIMPLLQLIDSVMIVNILAAGGLSAAAATSLYGVAGAPVAAVVNLPPVVTAAVAAAAMPRFTSAATKGESVAPVADGAMRYAHVVGIGGGVLIAVFASELLTALFSGGLTAPQIALAASIMRISAVGVPYVCYMQIVTTYLQAQGKAHVPAFNLLLGGALKASLTALLLQTVGIEGSAIATVCAYALTLALDFAYVGGALRGVPLAPLAGASVSALVAALAGSAARLIPVTSSLLAAALCVGVFGPVFVIGLIVTRTVDVRRLLRLKLKNNSLRMC